MRHTRCKLQVAVATSRQKNAGYRGSFYSESSGLSRDFVCLKLNSGSEEFLSRVF